jgi:hypothetical protein
MTNRRSDAGGAPVFASHSYEFDAADRRNKATRGDGTWWSYSYNDLNQYTTVALSGRNFDVIGRTSDEDSIEVNGTYLDLQDLTSSLYQFRGAVSSSGSSGKYENVYAGKIRANRPIKE